MNKLPIPEKKKALIIGSGIAGMATAIRLQHKGYEVEVFEANAYPGGKLSQIKQGNYRFDAGPSLFTMPQYVDELFSLWGRDPKTAFPYTKKAESCRYFWNDNTRLTAHADNKLFAHEVEQKLDVPARVVLEKLRKSKEMYELAGRTFLEKPLNKTKTWLSADVLKALFHLPGLGIFSTMHRNNKKMLQHPKLVQLFNRYATYNGSDPYRAPAILNIIPHFEHGIGTFHPVNGMHQITESLVNLAREVGVKFHFNERVTGILYEKTKVTGLTTEKGNYAADVVVSNMDITPTYRRLLPHIKAPEYTLSQEKSSSALIFYWGINKRFPELGLHNIFFSNDYEQEFRDIFAGKVPAQDSTVYTTFTSKDVAGDAPEGTENWFVMVNVPQDKGQDWEQLSELYKKAILEKLTPILGVDPGLYIENESVLTPALIELRTSSGGGSLYGTSSHSRYAAFLRHTNDSSKIKDLYFCGGSVHPGGGLPLCLLSAKIVSELCP